MEVCCDFFTFLKTNTFLSPAPSLLSVPFPYLYPLNPAKGLGERCKLPQRVQAELGRQTLLVHFQTVISALFHLHNDRVVIFAV